MASHAQTSKRVLDSVDQLVVTQKGSRFLNPKYETIKFVHTHTSGELTGSLVCPKTGNKTSVKFNRAKRLWVIV